MKLEEILSKLAQQFENRPEDLAPYVRTLVNMNQEVVKEVCREYWQRGGKHFPELKAFVERVKDLTPKPPPPVYNIQECLGCRNDGMLSMYSDFGYELIIKCECPRGKSLNLPTIRTAKSHGYIYNREQYREYRKFKKSMV